MGQPKQTLPWGDSTVLRTVVDNLSAAGAGPVVCVLGHLAAEIAVLLEGSPAVVVFNEDYSRGDMLRSYQLGVQHIRDTYPGCPGVLLALGDQPHVPVHVIKKVCDAAYAQPQLLVIPSHNMRRGHPIYLPRPLWDDLLILGEEESLRTLLQRQQGQIAYVDIDTDAILRDMDTPTDYASLSAES
jgi:molybdenum cofactor cytidylyltransferase